MDFAILFSSFIGLISILNPVGNVAIFLEHVQSDSPKVQRAMAILMGLAIFSLLVFFFFTGRAALNMFSITIPAFRIAGGILILLVGIRMMQGKSKFSNEGIQTTSSTANPFEEASLKIGNIIVPVAMPLFVGPGTITTVILFSDKTVGVLNYIGMIFVLLVCSVIVTMCLLSSRFIYKILGNNGMQIIIRFMGMILCAMAVQFMIDGLAQLLPVGFISPDFAHTVKH
ncbi:multiple antibiotic resistance protein [Elusimicrobium simillimum]|uniref:MarC family protein n=1 Tax=Elusimicrobium simillimum TaxID=3143438 RepID=UPI003C6FD007